MTVGTVAIYRTKGSRSCNQYPFIHGTDRPSKAVTYSNVKFTDDTVQDITVPEFTDWTWYNLVELKSDDGTFDEFYWITGASRSSTVQGAIILNLYWNAPTTVAYKGVGITGEWQYFPRQTNPNARVTPVAGQNVPQRFIPFPDEIAPWIDYEGTAHRIAWVSVVSTSTTNVFFGQDAWTFTRGGQTIDPKNGGSYEYNSTTGDRTPYITADRPGFNVYGFPVLLDQFGHPSTADHVGIMCYGTKDGTADSTWIQNAPTVYDVMSAPENVGFVASDIVDISFSFSCPYRLDYIGQGEDSWTGRQRPVYALRIDPDTPVVIRSATEPNWVDEGETIVSQDAMTIDGVSVFKMVYTTADDSTTQLTQYVYGRRTVNAGDNSVVPQSANPNVSGSIILGWWCVLGYTGAGGGHSQSFLEGNLPSETRYDSSTVTIDNRYNQTIQIRDYSGTLMQEIPLDMFTVNGTTGTLPFTEHVHTDYDGMFRHIIIGDADSDTNMQIVLQEPKLPRTENAWQTYRAQSMNDDRNAVISNLAFNVAGTAIGGVAGLAGIDALGAAGLNNPMETGLIWTIAGGGRKGQGGKLYTTAPENMGDTIARNQLIGNVGQQMGSGILGAAQSAYGQYTKERAIQRQPTTVVSMGYGLGQVIVSTEYPPGFMVSYPRGTLNDGYEDANLTNAPVTNYVERHGYPVQSIIGTALGTGYYQGIVYSSDELSGPKLDELNNCLMQGVQMVNI